MTDRVMMLRSVNRSIPQQLHRPEQKNVRLQRAVCDGGTAAVLLPTVPQTRSPQFILCYVAQEEPLCAGSSIVHTKLTIDEETT